MTERQEPAEVPVARGGLDQQQESAVGKSDVCSDQRSEPMRLGALPEARCAVEPVEISEGNASVSQLRGACSDVLGKRCTTQERESAPTAKLPIGGIGHRPIFA
jgi:hypothetical protein